MRIGAAALALVAAACAGGPGAPDTTIDGGDFVPSFSFDPTTQDFGELVPGFATRDFVLTVVNHRLTPTGPITIAVTGPAAADFQIDTVDTTCGVALDASDVCLVSMRFTPSALGARSATLTATDGVSSATASLTGRGVLSDQCVVTPTPFDFGGATVGDAAVSHWFTVRSPGAARPVLSAAFISGVDASDFTVGRNACQGMLLDDTGCELEVLFAPTATGMRNATLSAICGATVTAVLSGTGR